MAFLDIPSPNPRTKEYYETQRQHAYNLYHDAVSLGHSDLTLKMLLTLVEIWQEKANNLE